MQGEGVEGKSKLRESRASSEEARREFSARPNREASNVRGVRGVVEQGQSGNAGPGLAGAGSIPFLVLVRARSGQVWVEAQSVGPRLLKVQNYVSLKAELVCVSLALPHRALSASRSLFFPHFIFLPVFCLRLSSSVLTNVLLARRFFFIFFKSLSVCKNYAETEATKGKPQLSEDVCKVCVVAVCVCGCGRLRVYMTDTCASYWNAPLSLFHLPLQVATVNGCGIGTIQFSLLNNAWEIDKSQAS